MAATYQDSHLQGSHACTFKAAIFKAAACLQSIHLQVRYLPGQAVYVQKCRLNSSTLWKFDTLSISLHPAMCGCGQYPIVGLQNLWLFIKHSDRLSEFVCYSQYTLIGSQNSCAVVWCSLCTCMQFVCLLSVLEIVGSINNVFIRLYGWFGRPTHGGCSIDQLCNGSVQCYVMIT